MFAERSANWPGGSLHQCNAAENRCAQFEYFLEEFFEARIASAGAEVKSLLFDERAIAEASADEGWPGQRDQHRHPAYADMKTRWSGAVKCMSSVWPMPRHI